MLMSSFLFNVPPPPFAPEQSLGQRDWSCWCCLVGGCVEAELDRYGDYVSQAVCVCARACDGVCVCVLGWSWVEADLTFSYSPFFLFLFWNSLDFNGIGDAGAASLADALKQNSTVTRIE